MSALTAVIGSMLLSATANSAVRGGAGSDAIVTAVACAPGGSCAAGGRFVDASLRAVAFVLTGKNGHWGRAIQVPGLAALHPKNANVSAVSCASGGCAAGGYYQDASLRYHAFVTTERGGRWARLTTVASAKKGSTAITGVGSLSCLASGSCVAAGGRPAFVVSEAHGGWGRALQFPAEGKIGQAVVSCASAGNCSAGWGKFVVRERNGRWGKPAAVPGLTALGTGAQIASVSCPVAASCVAGGTYQRKSGTTEVFVANERSGRWRKAIEIPGFTALNKEGSGELTAVSCVSAGNCVAGGSYAGVADFQGGAFEAFVANERNGRWGKAMDVAGIPPPSSAICEPDSNRCVAGNVLSVSCARGGSCAVGGWYDTKSINGQAAFVAGYKNGRWTKAIQIPGLKALDTAKSSQVNSVTCTPAGPCAAGGSYSTAEPLIGPAFVTFEKNGTWGKAQTVRF